MASIQSTARRTTKQDATKKTKVTAKGFTGKSPSFEKTGYRFCRLGKNGKILAASRETVSWNEAETIGNEFSLEVMVARPDLPAGARIMHLRKPVLDRLAALREQAEAPELIVAVYIVLTPWNKVLTATESKRRAEIYRDVYDRYHEAEGSEATVIKRQVSTKYL